MSSARTNSVGRRPWRQPGHASRARSVSTFHHAERRRDGSHELERDIGFLAGRLGVLETHVSLLLGQIRDILARSTRGPLRIGAKLLGAGAGFIHFRGSALELKALGSLCSLLFGRVGLLRLLEIAEDLVLRRLR